MERNVGTISRGIRCPIIREGDDLKSIVVDSVLTAGKTDGFDLRDRDIICVTESVVARAQGNYVSTDDIAADVRRKLGGETIGVIFPILSRNRFAICLRGIAKGAKKIVLMLSYPSDEVGNELVSLDRIDEAGVNPYSDVLTLERYRELFGENRHQFTGVDYVEYYGDLIREAGAEVEIIFANQPREILKYTKKVLTCDIHTRQRTKRILREAGAEAVLGLDDIMTAPEGGSGCNERFSKMRLAGKAIERDLDRDDGRILRCLPEKLDERVHALVRIGQQDFLFLNLVDDAIGPVEAGWPSWLEGRIVEFCPLLFRKLASQTPSKTQVKRHGRIVHLISLEAELLEHELFHDRR